MKTITITGCILWGSAPEEVSNIHLFLFVNVFISLRSSVSYAVEIVPSFSFRSLRATTERNSKVLFIILQKVVLILTVSVDEVIKCGHSNESY